MRGWFRGTAAMVILAAWWPCAAPGQVLDRPETSINIGAEKEDKVATLMREADKGDGRKFVIKTDSDISQLKKGDIYTDALKTFFTVTRVTANGTSGGEFEVERTAGTNDPDRRFRRISSVDERTPGPAEIIGRVTLLDLMHQGGWPVYMIAGLAAIMIMLSLNCIVLYRKARQCPPGFVKKASDALAKGDLEGFEKAALEERGLLPIVCRAMTDRFETSTPEDIERRCEIAAAGRISGLRLPAKLINVISVAAPLLGLFGTIVGMVVVFEAVATTTGAAKATALAAGIRVKLFSTAAALLVAIPSVFAYFIFSSMLGGVIAETERVSEQFMHQILLMKRKKQAAKKAAREKAMAEGDGAKSPVVEA